MTDTSKVPLLDLTHPITRFLADGGSWADAVEMEYEQILIPMWSAQLRASLGKKAPSAERRRQVLIRDLREAYSYCGVRENRVQEIISALLTP